MNIRPNSTRGIKPHVQNNLISKKLSSKNSIHLHGVPLFTRCNNRTPITPLFEINISGLSIYHRGSRIGKLNDLMTIQLSITISAKKRKRNLEPTQPRKT